MTLPQGRLPVVSFPDPSPSSVDLPSYGTPGYTSLTMARARAPILKSSNCNTVSGHVDLTRSGLAQTTMATIEVVRGISASRSLLSFGKRFRPSTSPGPGVLKNDIGSGMGFTSYREPPRYVPSGSVLVQVWAVGVDIVDWRIARRKAGASVSAATKHHAWSSHTNLIRTGSMKSVLSFARSTVSSGRSGKDSGKPPENEKERKPEVGFIPGRSFVGRVMEFGWEVKETEGGKRGKWVIGLGDIRKASIPPCTFFHFRADMNAAERRVGRVYSRRSKANMCRWTSLCPTSAFARAHAAAIANTVAHVEPHERINRVAYACAYRADVGGARAASAVWDPGLSRDEDV
jgi:hypothetical protein